MLTIRVIQAILDDWKNIEGCTINYIKAKYEVDDNTAYILTWCGESYTVSELERLLTMITPTMSYKEVDVAIGLKESLGDN